MKKNSVLVILISLLTSVSFLQAQEVEINPIDTLTASVESAQSDLSLLKKIKFSGYVQAQWQKADTIGAPSVAGGDFKTYDNRFQVRRARLKAAYSGENTQVVVQLDLKDNGSVLVKEAYGVYKEPLLNAFSLTGGFFNRPIGYEVEYSSASLESPERSRITQTLFPEECDLGAKLTIQAPKTSSLNFLKLEAGLFNGNAIYSETDNYKDFIGHLSLKHSLLGDNLIISGGASYYNGGWALPVSSQVAAKLPHVFTINGTAFAADSAYKVGDKIGREYYGVDAQVTLSSALGITTVRGEYLFGTQPGTDKSTTSPKSAAPPVIADVYVREFTGAYVYFIQRILQTKHEFVVKYDWYDPNKNISADEIGVAGSKTSAADIKYTTIGLGWNYYATTNAKLSVYYDMVSNEKSANVKGKATGIDNFSKDLKDNVLTVRVLFKF